MGDRRARNSIWEIDLTDDEIVNTIWYKDLPNSFSLQNLSAVIGEPSHIWMSALTQHREYDCKQYSVYLLFLDKSIYVHWSIPFQEEINNTISPNYSDFTITLFDSNLEGLHTSLLNSPRLKKWKGYLDLSSYIDPSECQR